MVKTKLNDESKIISSPSPELIQETIELQQAKNKIEQMMKEIQRYKEDIEEYKHTLTLGLDDSKRLEIVKTFMNDDRLRAIQQERNVLDFQKKELEKENSILKARCDIQQQQIMETKDKYALDQAWMELSAKVQSKELELLTVNKKVQMEKAILESNRIETENINKLHDSLLDHLKGLCAKIRSVQLEYQYLRRKENSIPPLENVPLPKIEEPKKKSILRLFRR